MRRTLRVLVVGQSPQPEIEAQIALAAFGLSLRLEGALDGMIREQIATQAAPRSDADTQFTVLPSGEAVTISKEVVIAADWTCAN
jgi:protein AroM